MTPFERQCLRVDWYGLSFGWPLTKDANGRPDFLAANENGVRYDDDATSVAKAIASAPVAREVSE